MACRQGQLRSKDKDVACTQGQSRSKDRMWRAATDSHGVKIRVCCEAKDRIRNWR